MRVGPNTRITLSDELKGPRDRVLIRRQSETIPFSDLDPPLQALLQGQEEGASNWEHPDILPGPEELEKELREDNALVRVTVPRSELPEGKLEIGGISVIIAVGSPHRDESFQACRYLIEQLKIRAPIWKQEHYVDGVSEWVKGHTLCGHHHG